MKLKKSSAGALFVIFLVIITVSLVSVKLFTNDVLNDKGILRRAAYAGAIAGAQVVDINTYEQTGVANLKIDEAKSRAYDITQLYLKNSLPSRYQMSDVQITTEAQYNYIKVYCQLNYKYLASKSAKLNGIMSFTQGLVLKSSWQAKPYVVH